MKSLRVPLALAAMALFPSTGFSQEAAGAFLVKGSSTPFRHAYAFWKDQAPFSPRVDLYVLLSDVPVAEDQLPGNDAGKSKIAELVRSNKIHAVEIHFADPGKTLNSGEEGAAYNAGIESARHGLNGYFQYQQVSYTGDALAGKVSTDADTFKATGVKIDATFKVKVPPKK